MQLTVGDIIVYVTVFFGLFTSIFFLLVLLGPAPAPRKRREGKLEKVCIIVPCYNEEHTVARTIESLLALDYPRRLLDIIVVDDGSTDGTHRIARRYERRGVRVFRKENGGKYTALNFALERTDAAFVGALDADSHVHPKALRRIVPYFSDPRVMAVTPSMKIHEPRRGLQRVQWTEFLLGIFLRKAFARLGAVHVTPGPFSIYRKAFFDMHGNYKEAHHTEDIEMALRIQSRNYEIENANDAYVYTHGPSTFKGLWDQRLRWYYGFLRNLEDYRQLFSKEHGALGLFILPSSLFSVFLVIVGVCYWAGRLLLNSWDKLLYWHAIGWDIWRVDFSFDAFFVNMSSTMILGWIALASGVVVILVAKRLAGERKSIVVNYLWFFFLYWILYGAWWAATLFARATGRKVSWKHKSEA